MSNDNGDAVFTAEQLNKLYQYGLSIVRDRDVAYDLLQSALLGFLEVSSKEINEPIMYIRKSIRNAAINLHRSNSKSGVQYSEDDDQVIDTDLRSLEQTIVDQDDIERVWVKLTTLEREILFLWAVEGYTIDEIATLTGTSRGTLLSRVHRLRRRIQAISGYYKDTQRGEKAL